MSLKFSHLNMSGGILRITSFDLSVITGSTVYLKLPALDIYVRMIVYITERYATCGTVYSIFSFRDLFSFPL